MTGSLDTGALHSKHTSRPPESVHNPYWANKGGHMMSRFISCRTLTLFMMRPLDGGHLGGQVEQACLAAHSARWSGATVYGIIRNATDMPETHLQMHHHPTHPGSFNAVRTVIIYRRWTAPIKNSSANQARHHQDQRQPPAAVRGA